MDKLTSQDIKFLKELQHEMLTQDTVCQANPRFWVVQGTVREYGCESGYSDGMVVNGVDDEEYEDVEEFIKVLIDNGFLSNGDIVEGEKYDFEEIIEKLDDDDFRICCYKNVDKNYPDTMFLTNRECKEHIRANHYHYPKDAHSYAMTAWRSPQVEKLYKILENTDWDSIQCEVQDETF